MKDLLKQALENLCHDYNVGTFVPILEADVAAYLYHLWILESGKASNVHLDTRIHQRQRSFFDFVTGRIDYGVAKPCISNPELIAEIKAFPIGFTHQQNRRHYFQVIERDLPKLASVTNPQDSRFEILFNENNYLGGNDVKNSSSRMAYIIKTRDTLDGKIRVVFLKKTAGTLECKIL